MKKNKKKLVCLYVFCDLIASLLAWILLYIFRKHVGEGMSIGDINFQNDPTFIWGCVLLPVCWVLLHGFIGYYNKVYRKSRLDELVTTFGITLFGVLIFFFAFILDDIIITPNDYLKYLLVLFFCQFLLTYIPRVIITTTVNHRLRKGIIGFNTAIIGCGESALQLYDALKIKRNNVGNFLLGYIKTTDTTEDLLNGQLTCLGEISNLSAIIAENQLEELTIALQNGQRKYMEELILLARDNRNITLSIVPQTQDLLMGNVKTSSVMHEPTITVTPDYLPTWQKYIKRGCDIVLSVIAMILLLPVYVVLAIGVKKSSKGPIFYRQERIGYLGKPFKIIKFRSMYVNAEEAGPMLSSKTDSRITPFGKWMRQYRLDETPQFFNVLIGDMSLVGPRPERQYYIDKISERAPYYKLLLGIKPGITSWGQVKFGYAENVDEMIQRLRWDLLYIENMSLQMDVKILIYTVLIVLRKEGE